MSDPLFRAWPVFLLRAPALGGVATPLAVGSPPDGGPDAHVEVLRAALASPRLVEAVTLASPSLATVLDHVAEGRADRLRPKQLRRAALAVLRYDVRMRTRPTPFGLFAGVACGRFDTVTKIEWGDRHRHRTHIDMNWLYRLIDRLESDERLVGGLRVRAHQNLVVRGDRVVLEVPSGKGATPGQQTRQVVSVRRTPVVAAAIDGAARPVPFGDLARDLADRFAGGDLARVRRLLMVLAHQELLITELRPALDGADPLAHVIGVLDRAAEPGTAARAVLDDLRGLDTSRAAFDAAAPGSGRDQMTELVAAARKITDYSTPLHVDTRLDIDITLSERVRDEVERTAEVLWRLSPPRLGMRPLREYHGRFLERYGVDRLVPVLELLDPTRSLGAPAGYEWPESEAVAEPWTEPVNTRRDRLVAALAMTALRDGATEVVLDQAQVAQIAHDEADPADLPNSCELYVHVVAGSAAELDAGEFRVVVSPSPGSHHAGATVGRFLDLLPEWADELGERTADRRQHVAGAVAVDLAFAPKSGKAANLAHTVPRTRRRITVGLSDSPHAQELPLAEIGVGANLERMFAVHLPTGQEIVPVLPNMVSPAVQAPNAIRLLWELGMEGQRLWEPWNWGPMATAPFLPRVRYGRSVLAPATWRLDALRAHLDQDSAAWAASVAQWRRQWRVPNRILAVSTDQRLLLHLDHPWHLELLRDEIRRDDEVVAQELANGGQSSPDNEIQGHVCELVVPLAPRTGGTRPPQVAHAVPRTGVPALAGDWLYLVVRGSRHSQDEFLAQQVPVLVDVAAGGGGDRWFFIRYTDADGHHLRLRFHGDPALLGSTALPEMSALLASWQRAGLVGGHSLEQYEPEWERYGGPDAQVAAERLFHADSVAAIALSQLVKQAGDELTSDAVGAVSVAALAHAFGAPTSAAEWVSTGDPGEHAAEWLSITGSRRDLPAVYRKDAAGWQRRIDPVGGWPALVEDEHGARALAALTARDAAAREYGEVIRRLVAEGRCRTPEARIVGSLMHMTCNRLFGGSSEREQRVLGIARGAVQDNRARRRNTR
ncbi:lantibiotic dehydratase [Actinokineospora iranica]|uniref:Thiopeptide-type bacteriocin biosynthesis domain-containing protein n=1 Tax=Actinokineospora iranica TaxID=1271860 RepID=A0A1G6MEE7_9PSEU|nr:lantibiotic dehydratase [Actinokineospora iranica]SDC53821.1 thiopeptide-type bacteriocin biosynthesis domain-containing protein [Actinokineospora iranica]